MGYRGKDVSTPHGAWGRQTPWQSPSDDYQADDGAGYGPGDGYGGQGQPGYGGYGQRDEQYGGAPYGQQPPADQYGQPYRQHDGYEPAGGDSANGWGTPGNGWGSASGGYGGQQEYGQGGYGQEQGASGAYPQNGYDSAPANGYGPGGGYPGQAGGGYPGQAGGGYQGQAGGGYQGQADSGYQSPAAGGYQGSAGSAYQGQAAGGYQGQADSGYQSPAGGGYPGQADSGYQSPAGGGYQGPRGGYGQSGGYPAQQAGGGRPALPSGGGGGGYPAQDAGNDWYGGQPAAARGGSFADTGSYRFNGLASDEYGTGPRGALRDPARAYAPGPQQDAGQLPTSVIPAVSGPQAARRNGQQERFDDNAPYSDDGYPAPAGRDAYDDYGPRADLAGPGGYRGPGQQAPPPSAGFGRDRDGYDEFRDSGDPYQDLYGDDGGPAAPRGPGRDGANRSASGPLGGKRLLLAALAVVVVGIVAVAAYVFLIKPTPSAGTPNAQGALPSGSAAASQQACNQQLGTYCHIEARTNDPTPLTTAELFPPAFTNEADKTSYSLVSTKLDKTCSNAVIGPDLIKQLKTDGCTQVLRASYVSGDGKIMGTIGVVNLATTHGAHYAGKVVGQNDFIAPLTSAKGVASKLGNGTGVVEAEYKGHYLILTWSEFVNGTTPSTKTQDSQLEQFSNDLVAGSANIDLSQRMVTGAAATPSTSSPAAPKSPATSASAKASATKAS